MRKRTTKKQFQYKIKIQDKKSFIIKKLIYKDVYQHIHILLKDLGYSTPKYTSIRRNVAILTYKKIMAHGVKFKSVYVFRMD